jgi:hypothetical protein
MSFDDITSQVDLTELDLSDNGISTLPDSIGNLRWLYKLDITYNQLSTLPESIGNLQYLYYTWTYRMVIYRNYQIALAIFAGYIR